jgi:2-polyprenyl-3-methyl-5-hydroxy-6-metoxy-1,4-benzoquinol methylase
VIRKIERRRLAIIREMMGEYAGLRVLEIGAGGGHVLRMFPDAELTACDVSQVYLDTARKNLAGYDVTFLKGEIDSLALPRSSFDRIICTEVLEHTRDPDQILAEIARLLTADGRAVITIPNDALINRAKRTLRLTPLGWALRKRINWGGDEYHLHQWSPGEFRGVLSRHFEVTAQRASPSDWLPVRACYLCRPHP